MMEYKKIEQRSKLQANAVSQCFKHGFHMICRVCDDLRHDWKLSTFEDRRQSQTQKTHVPFIMFKQYLRRYLRRYCVGANYSYNNMAAVKH